MVKHIVMWKLKDAAEGARREQNAQRLKEKLEALRQTIPEIRGLEVGLNINPSPEAFDVVLVSEFEDQAALAAYQNHPEHRRLISEFLEKVRSEKRVVDYVV